MADIKAHPESVNFLKKIDLKPYNSEIVHEEFLHIYSKKSGEMLGDFTLSVSEWGQNEYHVRGSCKGVVEGVDCGTTVRSLIPQTGMQTLQQEYTEYLKHGNVSLDKYSTVAHRDTKDAVVFEIKETAAANEKLQTITIEEETVPGFLSEGSCLILLRFLGLIACPDGYFRLRDGTEIKELTLLTLDSNSERATVTMKIIGYKQTNASGDQNTGTENQYVQIERILKNQTSVNEWTFTMKGGHIMHWDHKNSPVYIKRADYDPYAPIEPISITNIVEGEDIEEDSINDQDKDETNQVNESVENNDEMQTDSLMEGTSEYEETDTAQSVDQADEPSKIMKIELSVIEEERSKVSEDAEEGDDEEEELLQINKNLSGDDHCVDVDKLSVTSPHNGCGTEWVNDIPVSRSPSPTPRSWKNQKESKNWESVFGSVSNESVDIDDWARAVEHAAQDIEKQNLLESEENRGQQKTTHSKKFEEDQATMQKIRDSPVEDETDIFDGGPLYLNSLFGDIDMDTDNEVKPTAESDVTIHEFNEFNQHINEQDSEENINNVQECANHTTLFNKQEAPESINASQDDVNIATKYNNTEASDEFDIMRDDDSVDVGSTPETIKVNVHTNQQDEINTVEMNTAGDVSADYVTVEFNGKNNKAESSGKLIQNDGDNEANDTNSKESVLINKRVTFGGDAALSYAQVAAGPSHNNDATVTGMKTPIVEHAFGFDPSKNIHISNSYNKDNKKEVKRGKRRSNGLPLEPYDLDDDFHQGLDNMLHNEKIDEDEGIKNLEPDLGQIDKGEKSGFDLEQYLKTITKGEPSRSPPDANPEINIMDEIDTHSSIQSSDLGGLYGSSRNSMENNTPSIRNDSPDGAKDVNKYPMLNEVQKMIGVKGAIKNIYQADEGIETGEASPEEAKFPARANITNNQNVLKKRFEELKAAYDSESRMYMQAHGEIRPMVSQFIQSLLITKPVNVHKFAAVYFQMQAIIQERDNDNNNNDK